MGLFNKKEISKEQIDHMNWMSSRSYDSISGETAEISFNPTGISLYDCDGNSISFEGEEVPTRAGSTGGVLYTYGKAKQAVLQYMKENRYRFINSSDENVFRNFNYEDCRSFPIKKY